MMRSTKHERDELFNVRGKLISILKFLKSKGFKEEDVYKDLLLARDENGLPINHSAGKAPSSAGPSGAKNEKGQEKVEDVPAQNKTWSQVVKDATPTSPSFNLSYVPPANGESIVCPPDEILQEDREVDGGSTAKDAAPDKQLPVKTDPLVGDTSVPLDTHIKESTPAKRPSSPTPHDLSDNSATPLCTFRNLKKVDEIDMKKDNAATSGISELGEFQISKSQRKKLKK
ncbi:hypothetical protein ACET3Z_021323 [Daucus carota]